MSAILNAYTVALNLNVPAQVPNILEEKEKSKVLGTSTEEGSKVACATIPSDFGDECKVISLSVSLSAEIVHSTCTLVPTVYGHILHFCMIMCDLPAPLALIDCRVVFPREGRNFIVRTFVG